MKKEPDENESEKEKRSARNGCAEARRGECCESVVPFAT